MKILFIGHPGSGKTYAAIMLARATGVEQIDIDDLLHNLVYFFFRKPYRKAFDALLKDKASWIIDGYGGNRMPATIWGEADHIVYINLPKSELKQNVYSRYKIKKTNGEFTHGQHLFANVLKNLWQIYLLDGSMQRRIHEINHSVVASKLVEVHSRQELDDLISKLASRP